MEIEQTEGVPKDKPLLEADAAFIKAMAKVAHAEAAVRMGVSERGANLANHFADSLPLSFGKAAEKVEKAWIEISL